MKNPIHLLVNQIAQTRGGARLFSKTIHFFDRPLLRWTNGSYSATSVLTGLPTINLTTVGRKSGLKRTMPLVGVPDGDNLILIGSNFGGQRNPGWYYNLMANPEAVVVLNGRSQTYIAHLAKGKEREAAWSKAENIYAGYKNYKQWANHRDIPVMILEPKAQ